MPARGGSCMTTEAKIAKIAKMAANLVGKSPIKSPMPKAKFAGGTPPKGGDYPGASSLANIAGVKLCGHCDQVLPLQAFGRRSNGWIQSQCRRCRKKQGRATSMRERVANAYKPRADKAVQLGDVAGAYRRWLTAGKPGGWCSAAHCRVCGLPGGCGVPLVRADTTTYRRPEEWPDGGQWSPEGISRYVCLFHTRESGDSWGDVWQRREVCLFQSGPVRRG